MTGKPPADRNHADEPVLPQRVLAQKRRRRRVKHAEIGVSMFERCTGVRTKAPVWQMLATLDGESCQTWRPVDEGTHDVVEDPAGTPRCPPGEGLDLTH